MILVFQYMIRCGVLKVSLAQVCIDSYDIKIYPFVGLPHSTTYQRNHSYELLMHQRLLILLDLMPFSKYEIIKHIHVISKDTSCAACSCIKLLTYLVIDIIENVRCMTELVLFSKVLITVIKNYRVAWIDRTWLSCSNMNLLER